MQTTIHSNDAPPSAKLIGAESDADADYRTVSTLALVSLGLGLVSPLVYFGLLLMVLPIAGAVLGLLAIRRIATSDGALIGRAAALVGIAVSVASIAAAMTRTEVSQFLLSRQARATSVEWFSLLRQGNPDQALQLMTNNYQRPPQALPGAPVEKPAASPLDEFRANPVVHFLLEHAQTAPVEYLGDVVYDLFPSGEARVEQQFSVGVPPRVGDRTSSVVNLVLLRSRASGGGPFEWRISTATSDDVPVEPHDHAEHVH